MTIIMCFELFIYRIHMSVLNRYPFKGWCPLIRCGSATQQLRNLLLVAQMVAARSSNFLNYQANKNNSTNQKLLFIKNSKHEIISAVVTGMSGHRPLVRCHIWNKNGFIILFRLPIVKY